MDAERVLEEYLRETAGKPLGGLDGVRLNQAVNQLAAWGVSHPQSYDRLLAFRESGRVASHAPDAQDAELVADFEKMQGEWTMKAGPMTVEMTIKGDQGDVTSIDVDGKVAGRVNAKFTLSRSGAAKLMTRYLVGSDASQGDAVIYRIEGDSLIHAEGMLTGVQNNSAPKLREWKRVQ